MTSYRKPLTRVQIPNAKTQNYLFYVPLTNKTTDFDTKSVVFILA